MMKRVHQWNQEDGETNDIDVISQIGPRVFLSGIRPLEKSPELLRSLGITHILSCVDWDYISATQNKVLEANPGITILSLPYRDEIAQSLWEGDHNSIVLAKKVMKDSDLGPLRKRVRESRGKPLIEIGYRFIDDALENGGRVLVHCMAGISRSSSALIYYMMKKNHEDFQTALQRLRRDRKIVCPNTSFWLQLMRYQALRQDYTDEDSRAIIDYLQRARFTEW